MFWCYCNYDTSDKQKALHKYVFIACANQLNYVLGHPQFRVKLDYIVNSIFQRNPIINYLGTHKEQHIFQIISI